MPASSKQLPTIWIVNVEKKFPRLFTSPSTRSIISPGVCS